MKVAELNPYTVMEIFPSHREAIKKLFKSDPNFQSLCVDYHQCARALEFWSKSDLCEAPKRREEYQTLLLQLESEVLNYLGKDSNLNTNNTSYGD